MDDAEKRIRALEDANLKTQIYTKLIYTLALACGASLAFLWKNLDETQIKIATAEKQIDLAVTNALVRVSDTAQTEVCKAVNATIGVQCLAITGRSDSSRLTYFIPTDSMEVPIAVPARIRGFPQVTAVYCRAETLNGKKGIRLQVRFAGPAKGQDVEVNLMQFGMRRVGSNEVVRITRDEIEND
jgi:hypothetical protein